MTSGDVTPIRELANRVRQIDDDLNQVAAAVHQLWTNSDSTAQHLGRLDANNPAEALAAHADPLLEEANELLMAAAAKFGEYATACDVATGSSRG